MSIVRWHSDGDALAWGTSGIDPVRIMKVATFFAKKLRLKWPVTLVSGSDIAFFGFTETENKRHEITLNIVSMMMIDIEPVWNTSTMRATNIIERLGRSDAEVLAVMTLIHELRHCWQFENWEAKRHDAQLIAINNQHLKDQFSEVEVDAEIYERQNIRKAIQVFRG